MVTEEEGGSMDQPVVLGTKRGQHPDVGLFAVEEAVRRRAGLRVVFVSDAACEAKTVFAGIGEVVDARQEPVEVDFALVGGKVQDVLLGEARDASVLVLGADDAPWMAQANGLEISQLIAREADMPVIVVPRTTARGRVTTGVVAATDMASDLEGQLAYAFETAIRQRETLHVVLVAGLSRHSAARLRRSEEVSDVIESYARLYPTVRVRRTVESGYPVHTGVIVSTTASVLVLSQPRDVPGRLVSPPALSRLLRRSNAPVAVVPRRYDHSDHLAGVHS
jgi:hypothetical protein